MQRFFTYLSGVHQLSDLVESRTIRSIESPAVEYPVTQDVLGKRERETEGKELQRNCRILLIPAKLFRATRGPCCLCRRVLSSGQILGCVVQSDTLVRQTFSGTKSLGGLSGNK